jgi:drug/metabolite transporter (DMT)-like permease
LAGLLYLGSGLGLFLLGLTRRRPWTLAARDLPWLAGAVLSGGVLAPVLLMRGLADTPASCASLLLTSEAGFTSLIAGLVFREGVGGRAALGLLAVTAGSAVLVASGPIAGSAPLPALSILAACLAWAIDNNLTRKIANADPVEIAMIKGLCGGPVMLAVAFSVGAGIPDLGTIGLASLVGFLGIGVSLSMFCRALRDLGAARTGAYFSTAPFLGAAGAIVLLGEPVTLRFVVGGLLMGFGVYLHLTERHAHEHEHAPTTHEHLHTHDTHHQHAHAPGDPKDEPHSHRHTHLRLRHSHRHAPDMHHMHEH